MKAVSWIIAVILAILAIVFGSLWMSASNKTKGLEQGKSDLQKLYESSIAANNEIQKSLEMLDQELGAIGADNELPAGTPQERLAKLNSSIANARTKIDEYKKRIAELESKLASSNGQLAGIQSIVNKLKSSVADKEKIVSELEGRLSTLTNTLESERSLSQNEINQRDAQLRDKEALIASQNVENNKIYYAVGTRKELLASGIIDRKGGILGIGKVSTVKDAELTKFSSFNLIDTQQITFPATKKGYSVLSNHIAASYTVNKVEDQNVLSVIDNEQFRKQKILVIELK